MMPALLNTLDNFCPSCRTMLVSLEESSSPAGLDGLQTPGKGLHKCLSDIYNASKDGCPICLRFYHEIVQLMIESKLIKAPYHDTIQIEKGQSMEQVALDATYYSKYYVTCFGANFCFTMILLPLGATRQEILQHLSQGESFRRATLSSASTAAVAFDQWLWDCENHHSCGKRIDRNYIPPRLLDCQHDPVRLVEKREVMNIPSFKYAAMSHCWGKNPTHLSLTTDNLYQMIQGICKAQLPKSFIDAIDIVKKLGIQYLWIDSLCIIQSGPKHQSDLQLNIREMDYIYENCFVNIAAASAENADGGCFFERNECLSTPCVVELPRGLFVIESEKPPRFHIHSRGWVFQERLLSRRALSFTKDDVFWQCTELTARGKYPEGERWWVSEGLYPGSNETNSILLWDQNYGQEECLRYLAIGWQEICCLYSNSILTHRSDRLLAISAIAKRFHEAHLSDRYYAGYFKSDIPAALLWEPSSSANLPDNPRPSRIEDNGLPSWSWVSYPRKIMFNRIIFSPADCTVLSINIIPIDEMNEYGAIKEGRITLKGPAITVEPNDIKQYPTDETTKLVTKSDGEIFQWNLHLSLDYESDFEAFAGRCYFLSFHLPSKHTCQGLILTTGTSNAALAGQTCTQAFKRLGIFKLFWKMCLSADEALNAGSETRVWEERIFAIE